MPDREPLPDGLDRVAALVPRALPATTPPPGLRDRTLAAVTAATVELTELGIGRVIDLRSDSLPVLPRGEFYELWFATRDDRPGAPDRISAGTWHPDADGSSVVRFTGAVDPARNPIVVITREPADGDPAPSGREVLRGPAGDA